ncbi:MAG TPA: adenosylcobinamide amidohydrolase [Candidatus Acidoferrales bacterium]|nr:adenosylcobinamide amidohydrolase [Candidatus Acidoferrales bacterium]
MKYDVISDVLVINGCFEALSTGVGGGRRRVKYILNIQVPHNFSHTDPKSYIDGVARSLHLDGDYVALLTAVAMKNVQIVEEDYITVFATAGVTHPRSMGTINLIIVSSRELCEGAMANIIITATEAKTSALFDLGLTFTGTSTDAVVVAFERESGGETVVYGGPSTELGKKVTQMVRLGVKNGLIAHHGNNIKELRNTRSR